VDDKRFNSQLACLKYAEELAAVVAEELEKYTKDEIVERLAAVPKEKQADEGIKICVEQIEELKEEEGVRGFHIMAIEWEERVPEIVEMAGLYPRPKINEN
jgi:5,10-methylenetetrahydrofolate reductase